MTVLFETKSFNRNFAFSKIFFTNAFTHYFVSDTIVFVSFNSNEVYW